MNQKKTILIIEDPTITRYGLKLLIENETQYQCISEVSSIEQAEEVLQKEKVDLVIIDMSSKEGSGVELIKQIRKEYPQTKTLVITMHDESLFAERTLHAGAYGYIHKEQPTEDIKEAIDTVMEGNFYVSQEISNRLLKKSFQQNTNPESHINPSPLENLTDRELEVYDLIGRGYNTQQIADQLGVSTKTVENHRENIKHKLGIQSYTELIRHAVEWNISTQSGDTEL